MEQFYNIIDVLIKNPDHARNIAKILGTNHVFVSRYLNKLLRLNVVDFMQEGRNKRFFIKNTIEAKAYIYMTENYKLSTIIRKYPNIRSIIEQIQQSGYSMAILFGSYAKSTARKESDIDIYIETTNNNIKKSLENLDGRLSIKIGKFNKTDLLIQEIIKNHIIILGVERYYENTGFFEQVSK